jgi:hypothetical protein
MLAGVAAIAELISPRTMVVAKAEMVRVIIACIIELLNGVRGSAVTAGFGVLPWVVESYNAGLV